MKESYKIVNEVLVDIFNDILVIEQNAFQNTKYNNLSVTEIHTLEAVGFEGGKNMSEIAASLGITVGTLTIAINNLVKKEYVERIRSEKDRRVVKIALTRTGKVVYRIHEKFHYDMVKATVEGLSEEEEKTLVDSLDKLNNFFKNKYKLK
ncbi:MAG: MarR family winged helix-turn-helix transcriptional regulator [Clostridiaceae bacterium]